MERAPAALSDTVREHIARSLEVIRQRGYAMSGSGPAFRALRHFTVAPVGHQKDEAYWAGLRQLIADLSEREMQLLDFDEAGADGISFITAPVFSPAGQVSLELSLSGLPPKLTRTEFERYVERLRAAAAVVTSETHGREPPPVPGETAASQTAASQTAARMPHA
jgi:DNA-binding IclR family transcriptional regulator